MPCGSRAPSGPWPSASTAFTVGGLSVGEDRAEMLPALEAALGPLPAGRPRYFMGLGDPLGMVGTPVTR